MIFINYDSWRRQSDSLGAEVLHKHCGHQGAWKQIADSLFPTLGRSSRWPSTSKFPEAHHCQSALRPQ